MVSPPIDGGIWKLQCFLLLKTDFKVGERVRRTEGDTEVGSIAIIHRDYALVDFHRFDRIVQCFIKVCGLEPVEAEQWETSESRVFRT